MRAVVACVVILGLLPAPVRAQDAGVPDPHPGVPFTAPDIPPGPETRVPLRARELAPFEGILFDPPTLVRWANRIRWLEERLHLEHELHAAIEAGIRAAAEQERATLVASYEREAQWNREEYDRLTADLVATRAHVARLERRPWYRSFGFGVSLGAGLVLSATVLGLRAGR